MHRAAGVLLKVLSEQGYHLDIRPGDRMLYATTCGWMMWNWLVMGLGRSAADVLAAGTALITPAHLAPLSPIADVRGSADYRMEAAATLCARALALALEGSTHG